MSETFRPLADRLLVRRHDPVEKTPGGILLPDRAREKPLRGTVVAVGPGRLTEDNQVRPMNVSVGDVVVFGSYAGADIKVGDEVLLVLREDDVVGVVVPDGPKPKK